MNMWQEIETLGFYPELLTRTLRRVLGADTPISCLFQVEAAFDHGSMFNHLSGLVLTTKVLIQLHLDEQEDGTAMIATAIHPISSIQGVSFMEIVAAPEAGESSTQEVTIGLNLGAVRRADIEPAQCDDPVCTNEHGYNMVSTPDDVNMRISAAVDGFEALERAQHFIDSLTAMVSRND